MSDETGPAPSKRALLVAGIVAGAILLGFLAWRLVIVTTGDEIVLRPQVLDPRDPFRGDYVILTYPESRIDPADFGRDGSEFPEGSTLYLVLREGSPVHTPVRLETREPSLGAGESCMRGTVRSGGASLWVEYGIESYFVPEGRGPEVEKAIGEERVLAKARSGPGCAVGLTTLLIDGKAWPG